MKFEVRKFSQTIAKKKAVNKRRYLKSLEDKVKDIEIKLSNNSSEENKKAWYEAKEELENEYNNITQGIIIRSRAEWVEKSEKSNKYFFFFLEKANKIKSTIKGCRMGPWLFLVSPCFRGNVVATCKIGSFLCSLDNLLQENVLVLFFENQLSKWRSFEKKRVIFYLLFTFFSHQGKVTKIPSAHISLTYIHVFCSPY